MKYWVGVVQADHVARAVELGIAQINHGSRAGVTRLQEYDRHAQPAAIAGLRDTLEFTRDNPKWGYQLRLGIFEISKHDFDVVAEAMGSNTLRT